MAYDGAEGEYIDYDGETYGPYRDIRNNGRKGDNWGFIGERNYVGGDDFDYVLNGEVISHSFSSSLGGGNLFLNEFGYYFNYTINDEAFFRINEETYGPYLEITYRNALRDRTGFYFIYNSNESDKYIRVNDNVYGPFDKISHVKFEEEYYGFYAVRDGDITLIVNGDTYFFSKSDGVISDNLGWNADFEMNTNNWGFRWKSKKEDGKMMASYVINGDKFGPFDEEFTEFRIATDKWNILYKKEGGVYVLANGKPLCQLPVSEQQILDTRDFLASKKYKMPFQDPYCLDNWPVDSINIGQGGYDGPIGYGDPYRTNHKEWPAGKNWEVGYIIDGECVSFFDETDEEKISITNTKLYSRLKGKILLKVEDKGKAYYLNPKTSEAHYLGRPNDAFKVMREQGIGMSERDYNSFNGHARSNLAGAIMLRVEAKGEAYYVNPEDLKLHYLGRPADAFQVMRNLGMGITTNDFSSL